MKSYLDAGGFLGPVVVDGTIMRANRHHLETECLLFQTLSLILLSAKKDLYNMNLQNLTTNLM
jgi:hypothetical protein